MRKYILFTDSFCPKEDATSIYNTQILNKLCKTNEITVFCTLGVKSFTGISFNKNKNLSEKYNIIVQFNKNKALEI